MTIEKTEVGNSTQMKEHLPMPDETERSAALDCGHDLGFI